MIPEAIYYFTSHELGESDLAMGVGCMEFVDAAASGVLYTCDPLGSACRHMLVNSVFGLGSYLVEGELTPDVFHISREDGSILFESRADKPVQLRMA
ncbi:MAG: phosphoenolpyruvate synthase, partial [Desulfomonile tiedjei]|nr:phosphoenolpyruvate synthase [Desulfomonile tiedjei]